MAGLKKTLTPDVITNYVGEVSEKIGGNVRVRIGSRVVNAISAISIPILKNDKVILTKTDSGWRIVGKDGVSNRTIIERKING